MFKYIIGVLAIVGIVLIYRAVNPAASDGFQSITFAAQQGNLRITVLEGGNIEAVESQEIRSEITGRTGAKIMRIVEEGYLVTQEDIDNELILVELETSTLEDELVNQEIATQTAEANYTERKAQFDIQLNLNQSAISAADQAVKFSRMDFEKYLGQKAVEQIISQLNMGKYFSTEEENKIKSSLSKAEVATNESTLENRERDGNKEISENEEERPKREGRGEGEGRRVGGDGRGEGEGRRRGGEGRGDRAQGEARGEGAEERQGGGEGRRGFDPQRIKQMIEDNGGEIPEAMKDRLEAMGMSVEDMMKRLNAEEKPEPKESVNIAPEVFTAALDDEYLAARAAIDFTKYANEDTLEDGEALQMLRKLKSDSLVAVQDAQLAKSRLMGQERLAEKNFITKTDLELERVKYDKSEINVETTKTDRDLYIKYTFPKMAEKYFSDYEEALMNLQRKRQEAHSKMAQEHAQMTAAERKFNLEKIELKDVKDQLSKCTIRALRPGLVVYGSSTNKSPWRRSNEEPIQEGTTLRERQSIITIPDMTRMGVKVDIHESAVQKVAIGQTVSISIDAFPGQLLEGEVTKVAVLADSANAFMNPDLKVYPTVISIKGVHDWLRPGMSAKVEILINELENVVYIPIQAVTYDGDKQICYVKKGGSTEIREVTLGSFTEEFIEIKSGLSVGEDVLMLIPTRKKTDDSEMNDESQPEPAAPAA